MHADGSFALDMDYFSFHHSLSDTCGPRFVDLFGPPRQPESPFFTRTTGEDVRGRESEADKNQYYADVAASVQAVTEQIVLDMVNRLHRDTGQKNLVMAGGVALNSVANGRVMRETPFEQVYIQPNAGDAGGALGAALYAWHVLFGKPRSFIMRHARYGEEYDEARIERFLKGRGVRTNARRIRTRWSTGWSTSCCVSRSSVCSRDDSSGGRGRSGIVPSSPTRDTRR